MSTKVMVIGGGVAGMSAAHELREPLFGRDRIFEVDVYERRPDYVGGKARSLDVPDSAAPGYKPLPGEHGFRFFPAFYRHITDTMKRIPLSGDSQGRSAFDNLVAAEKEIMARPGHPPLILLNHLPRSLKELHELIDSVDHADIDFTDADKDAIATTLWRILTSCWERRSEEYERMSWWAFCDADHHSEAYRTYFTDGLTRTLVAAKSRKMSAKTGGDILIQLLLSMFQFDGQCDRVLNGPTNEAWLNPWLTHLKHIGVNYHQGWEAQAIKYDKDTSRVEGVVFTDPQGNLQVRTADYYLFAVPVESMARLVGIDTLKGSFPARMPPRNQDLLEAVPTLRNLGELADDTSWMNGIQYYLNQEIGLLDTTRGHVIYSVTPWALTSISQLQFWPHTDMRQYGNGQVKSILSVDISNWESPGYSGKPARACTPEEVRDEVWAQLQKSLNVDGKVILPDLGQVMVSWYLDRDIVEDPNELEQQLNIKTRNQEPLLVNEVDTWANRPSATTAVPNLLLASDYVRTFTDLATMEGANEAARRAVNAIISQTKAQVPFCQVWNLHEPWEFAIFKWLDRWRYYRGLPWRTELPMPLALLHTLYFLLARLGRFLRR